MFVSEVANFLGLNVDTAPDRTCVEFTRKECVPQIPRTSVCKLHKLKLLFWSDRFPKTLDSGWVVCLIFPPR